jgi:hypothetical protein
MLPLLSTASCWPPCPWPAARCDIGRRHRSRARRWPQARRPRSTGRGGPHLRPGRLRARPGPPGRPGPVRSARALEAEHRRGPHGDPAAGAGGGAPGAPPRRLPARPASAGGGPGGPGGGCGSPPIGPPARSWPAPTPSWPRRAWARPASSSARTPGRDRPSAMTRGSSMSRGCCPTPTPSSWARPGGGIGLARPAGRGGVLDRHRGPGDGAGPPDGDHARQGIKARRHPPAAEGGPRPRPGRQRAALRPAPAGPLRATPEPPRRRPDRPAPGQGGGDHHTCHDSRLPAGPLGRLPPTDFRHVEKYPLRALAPHTKHISPHSLRHSFITAALDAGVPCGTSRSPPVTPIPATTRYDRARHNLDRHASYIVTAFVAGAS